MGRRFTDQTGIRARTLEAMWHLDGHAWLRSDGEWHGHEMPNWIFLGDRAGIGVAHPAMLSILGPHMSKARFTLAYFVREREEEFCCLAFLDGNAAITRFRADTPLASYPMSWPGR